MERAAFAGNYADFKLIKTRSVATVCIEIPIEQAAEFIKKFGIPSPAEEIPVALALLNADPNPWDRVLPKKERKSFEDLPPATQAALTGQEPEFWAYLREEREYDCESEKDAAAFVREFCEVQSRGEIKPGTRAAQRWQMLVSVYQGWKAAERAGA